MRKAGDPEREGTCSVTPQVRDTRILASWLWSGACPFTLLSSPQRLQRAPVGKVKKRKGPILPSYRTHRLLKL